MVDIKKEVDDSSQTDDPISVAREMYEACPEERIVTRIEKSYFANKNVFSDLCLEDVPHPPRK